MVPPIGTRYYIPHVKSIETVLEYTGLNPDRTRGDDEHLLRAVSAPVGGYKPGALVAVEERWFETHQQFLRRRT